MGQWISSKCYSLILALVKIMKAYMVYKFYKSYDGYNESSVHTISKKVKIFFEVHIISQTHVTYKIQNYLCQKYLLLLINHVYLFCFT